VACYFTSGDLCLLCMTSIMGSLEAKASSSYCDVAIAVDELVTKHYSITPARVPCLAFQRSRRVLGVSNGMLDPRATYLRWSLLTEILKYDRSGGYSKWKMEMGASTKGLSTHLKVLSNPCLRVREAGTNVGYRRNRKESPLYYSEADITLPTVSWLSGFL